MLLSITKKINQYSFFATSAIIIIVFTYVGYFIYKNYYSARMNTAELLKLYREVPDEYIDINKFNKVISVIEDKTKTSTSTAGLNDLFSY